ncbi:MAG: hypothetical protein P1U58_18560 [Verrucomicrobiales bacterium]|nr:hypothetical protein [Verrucomicrobiales bacterium]
MKSPIPDRLKKSRNDLSDYLWHFCREDKQTKTTLLSILDQKVIRAAKDPGSGEKVVCFTEAPLEEMRRQAPQLRKAMYNRFSLFGIGFRRDFVFKNGGLPVVYQPAVQLNSLPADYRWRHVEFDLQQGIDYTWQREWRIKGDLDFREASTRATVVVPDAGDFVGELFDIEDDGDVVDKEPVSTPFVRVYWNFVSLDWYPEPLDDSRIKVVTWTA